MNPCHDILQKYWGYSSFRPLQEDIINSVLAGKDTLGLMPTGGGKSLTFQVPAMIMQGICIVVTPLIALMKDQVDNLKQRGIRALAVYSGMSYKEIITTLENAVLGDYKFLYISPERLSTELFLAKLKSMQVSLLVVDEAHCISQWGYDFRPSYLNIAGIRRYFPDTQVLALTATATKEVIKDIQEKLEFKGKNVFSKSFKRDDLVYSVSYTENKQATLFRLLEKIPGSAIVYVRSRQRTKEIAQELSRAGMWADFYHAGLNDGEKTCRQEAWKKNSCRIMVCTNAFGMGIDKPDVRLVVHLDLPNSLEEYFQEAGRAGRDGEKSFAVVLYNKADTAKLKKRISDEFPKKDFIVKVYEYLAYFLQVAEGFGTGVVYDFNFQEFCSVYKLPLLPAHNALKILDLAGYIEYTEETENRSRLVFTVYREELYQYNFDEGFDKLINVILRLYTGLFTDYAYIDEGAIAARLGQKREQVYEMLKALSKRKVIDYIPYKKTPFILYKQPRIDSRYLSVPALVYEQRKKRFKERIEAVNEYVTREGGCRSRILLHYFGEAKTEDCGQCDSCLLHSKTKLTDKEFREIRKEIETLLDNKEMLIDETVKILSEKFYETKILKVIRFLLDNGRLSLQMDKLSLS